MTLERVRSVADEELSTARSVKLFEAASSLASLEQTTADIRHDRERLNADAGPDKEALAPEMRAKQDFGLKEGT